METFLLGFGSFSIVGLTILVILAITYFYRSWRNPKCSINGVLPPGSMGIPFIGELPQLLIPSTDSFDSIPFLKKRIARYGPIFKTNIAGMPVIVSADPNANSFLLRRDGDLMETWAPNILQFVNIDNKSFLKYTRTLILHHLGSDKLKGELLLQTEDMAIKSLEKWSNQESIEVKKIHKKLQEILKDVVRKRLTENCSHGDMLDHILEDMEEDDAANIMFAVFFSSTDSMPTTFTLAFKLLVEHPEVLEELTVEHEAILKTKKNVDDPLNWSDYKSMVFTIQVINEILRLANVLPGIFRRATKDIHINGYVIPEGWPIVMATSILHLNPDQFEDPLLFNPSRWKNMEPGMMLKCLMTFGSGAHLCPGMEFSMVAIATFLHVLVTKYRWTTVKGGKMVRAPLLKFADAFHIKISRMTD